MFGLFKRKPPEIELAFGSDGKIDLNAGKLTNCSARLVRSNSTLEMGGHDVAMLFTMAKMFGWPGGSGIFRSSPSGSTVLKLCGQHILSDSDAFELAVALENFASKQAPNVPSLASSKRLATFAAAGGFIVRLE